MTLKSDANTPITWAFAAIFLVAMMVVTRGALTGNVPVEGSILGTIIVLALCWVACLALCAAAIRKPFVTVVIDHDGRMTVRGRYHLSLGPRAFDLHKLGAAEVFKVGGAPGKMDMVAHYHVRFALPDGKVVDMAANSDGALCERHCQQFNEARLRGCWLQQLQCPEQAM